MTLSYWGATRNPTAKKKHQVPEEGKGEVKWMRSRAAHGMNKSTAILLTGSREHGFNNCTKKMIPEWVAIFLAALGVVITLAAFVVALASLVVALAEYSRS